MAAERAATLFAPGALLGDRYRLEEVVGAGGMATVWRAQDEVLARPVAIKLMSGALAADPAYVDRFGREARTAAAIAHANLVKIYDHSASADRPYLVMEYVPGGTLAQRLERGPLLPHELRSLACDLLAAIERVHDSGVLHRDIKPANVLLAEDGQPRLTDFGIARLEDSTRLTQPGQVIGTLRYLAPEVIDGAPASRQSDLYALGVLLREAAGEGAVDTGLRDVIAWLTEREPERRPRSAQEALALLRDPVGAVPTAATAVPTAATAVPAAATAVPAAATAATRAAPAVTALPTAATRAAPAPPAWSPVVTSTSPSRSRARTARLLVAGAIVTLVAVIAIVILATGGGSPPAARGSTGGGASRSSRTVSQRLDRLERSVRALQAK